ncbi:MAG: helix-turn-helix domain-containing protein [Chloroflexota bacterium]
MSATRTVRRVVRQKAKGPIDPSVGHKVRALRLRRGLTQRALAGAEFTKGFISHLETGRTRASLRAAGIIAERLGVKVTELLAAPTGEQEARTELRLLDAERGLAAGQPAAALDLLATVHPLPAGLTRARLRRLTGRALLELAKPAEAIRPLTEALEIATREAAGELRTRVLYDLADAHAGLDAPGEALGYLLEAQRALEAHALIDRTLELRVAGLLAAAYVRLGDLASAGRHAERATEIAIDVVDSRALASTYATLLTVREKQGDLEGALLYARKGLDLQENTGRQIAAAQAWNNIAWVQLQRGQLRAAEEAVLRALEIAQSQGVVRLRAHFLLTRGEIALHRGDPRAAEKLASEALAIQEARATIRASALLLIAQSLARRSAPVAEVRREFERALRAHGREPVRQQAHAHEAYAAYLAGKRLAREAYGHAQRALELQRPALAN